MYLGHLTALDRDRANLPPAIVAGLDFLAATDFTNLPAGRIDIDGDRMFALVQDYDTVPRSEKRPESHVRYMDIQYMVSGSEVMGWAPASLAPAPCEEHLADKDIQFFESVPGETEFQVGPGGYAVFFPTDVHRPACLAGAPERVRKVLVKIAV